MGRRICTDYVMEALHTICSPETDASEGKIPKEIVIGHVVKALRGDHALRRKVAEKLFVGCVRSGSVLAVFMAVDCQSWSVALHGAPGSNWCALRTLLAWLLVCL